MNKQDFRTNKETALVGSLARAIEYAGFVDQGQATKGGRVCLTPLLAPDCLSSPKTCYQERPLSGASNSYALVVKVWDTKPMATSTIQSRNQNQEPSTTACTGLPPKSESSM